MCSLKIELPSILINDILEHISCKFFERESSKRCTGKLTYLIVLDGDFHTIILYPDVMFENKFENKNDPSSQWQFIENIGVTFDKVENEPGDFYLVNTSMKHAVINFSQLPRYSGFFDLKYDISYEDMKELL